MDSYKIGDAMFSDKHSNFIVNLNNAKANEILQSLEVNKTEIPVEFAAKYNKQLRHPSAKPENREAVLEKFVSLPAKEINSWFRKKTTVARLKGQFKRLAPYSVKKKILRLKYKQ